MEPLYTAGENAMYSGEVFLVVQWLRIHLPSKAGDTGLIPGQETKIPHAMRQLNSCCDYRSPHIAMKTQCCKKKKKERKKEREKERECIVGQPLRKNLVIPQKVKHRIAIPVLSMCPRELKIHIQAKSSP